MFKGSTTEVPLQVQFLANTCNLPHKFQFIPFVMFLIFVTS